MGHYYCNKFDICSKIMHFENENKNIMIHLSQ